MKGGQVAKVRKGCDRCVFLKREGGDQVPARYRALMDRFLCDPCYPHALREVRAIKEFEVPVPLDPTPRFREE